MRTCGNPLQRRCVPNTFLPPCRGRCAAPPRPRFKAEAFASPVAPGTAVCYRGSPHPRCWSSGYILTNFQHRILRLRVCFPWNTIPYSKVLVFSKANSSSTFSNLKNFLTFYKPNGNSYTVVDNQDDTRLSRAWRFPVRGILMPLLGMIFWNGSRASEEDIWKFLNMMGIYDGESHLILGEPRQLISQDLVQQKYLVHQQVPNSDPPRCEFLWGPRAHAETSKMKILEFVAKLSNKVPTAFPTYYEEALKDEEERAQARAQAEPRAGSPSKASSLLTTASSLYPHPE